jgi:hypothetical protein
MGVQWLQLIVWDFKALSMTFVREGRSMHFVGCGGAPCMLYSILPTDNVLDALLATYTDIFNKP